MTLLRRAACVAGCLCLAVVAFVRPASAGAIEDILECGLRNLPPAGHAIAKLWTRPNAKAPEHAIDFEYWSLQAEPGQRRVLIARKNAEPDQVAAYLFAEGEAIGEAWEYIPAHHKPERAHAHGDKSRLFGTNLTLEDFARTARVLFAGQIRQLPDATVEGRPVYVVQTKPAPDAESEYTRIVTSIDKEQCLVLRRESFDPAFAKGAKPRKVYAVSTKDVRQEGAYFVATRASLEDAKDGSQTRLEVEKFDLPKQLDPKLFTPEALAHPGQ